MRGRMDRGKSRCGMRSQPVQPGALDATSWYWTWRQKGLVFLSPHEPFFCSCLPEEGIILMHKKTWMARFSEQASVQPVRDHRIGDAFQPSHLLSSPSPPAPAIPPRIRVFSNESTLHMRWPKYWSFSFSISPSNEHPGLISFKMDWLDLLAVQGTLKSLLQHHSSKASISSNIEHLSACLLAICISLEKCLFRNTPIFWLGCLFFDIELFELLL